jgi:hypothetical protein
MTCTSVRCQVLHFNSSCLEKCRLKCRSNGTQLHVFLCSRKLITSVVLTILLSLQYCLLTQLICVFVWWGEAESSWYTGHYWAYWYQLWIMSVGKLMEWETAGETQTLAENLPRDTLSNTNPTWPDRPICGMASQLIMTVRNLRTSNKCRYHDSHHTISKPTRLTVSRWHYANLRLTHSCM